MRHNRIRDLEATLLKEVCKDVRIELELLPIGNVELGGANTAEKARLDVSAVGICSPMERTFVDVRVMHPNSPSYRNKKIEQVYIQQETNIQTCATGGKGLIHPISFLNICWNECARYHKQLAALISQNQRGLL